MTNEIAKGLYDIIKKYQNGEFTTEEEFNEGLTKLFLAATAARLL